MGGRPAARETQHTLHRSKDLVFTLFGEYLIGRVETVWVGSLIALLESIGSSEGSVRTTLSRMAQKGWLRSERVGRSAFYALTDKGRRLLEEGQARIYHTSWDRPWDGSWCVVAYSIPQSARRQRDKLRERLAWLGFGSIGNGLWISPHDATEEIGVLAEAMRLDEHLLSFRAFPVGDSEDAELVERGWDLVALQDEYEAFVERWERIARAAGIGGAADDSVERGPALDGATHADVVGTGPVDDPRRCFALRFDLIHEYRAFPLRDPYLPRALLPAPWAGDAAAELFLTLHRSLIGPADRYVDAVLADAPRAPGGQAFEPV